MDLFGSSPHLFCRPPVTHLTTPRAFPENAFALMTSLLHSKKSKIINSPLFDVFKDYYHCLQDEDCVSEAINSSLWWT